MLYRLADLPKYTVAYVSQDVFAFYEGDLYINSEEIVSLTCNLATKQTIRIITLVASVTVAICTLPAFLEVPVLDNWVIRQFNFRPVELEKSFIGYSN